jgi:carbon monoxide dehydrogenase subunit G
MIVVEREIIVRRPAGDVFAFLADARNEADWNPNVVRIDETSGGPAGLGTTFVGAYRRGGRMRFEITAYEPPSRIVFDGGGRSMAVRATIRVTDRPDGAAVVMRAEMRPRGALRPLAPLMRPVVARQYADVAHRFRQAVES